MERVVHAQDIDKYTAAERMRMCFEQLGPTFVKFGQVLAARPDLIPEDFVEEFKKLHSEVRPLEFSIVQKVLEESYKQKTSDIFQYIDEKPLAAASIAQVHRAKLKDGRDVVIKIQRPGIHDVIGEDLVVLMNLAQLVVTYVEEARPFNPVAIVDELFKTLELETNFVLEAHNMIKFQQNFAEDPRIKIPDVYLDLTNEKILVMEEIKGIPLSNHAALESMGVHREEFVKLGLETFLKMVFKHGFFHGDLHAGNLMILPDQRIALIDFGVVGRVSNKIQDSIVNMFMAMASSDYERLAYEFIDIAPYNDVVDADQFGRELRTILAPYFGLTMKNVNLGKLLMDATGAAGKYHLQMPSELILFFKSIVTIEGMGKLVIGDFDILPHALEFASEIAKSKYDPNKIIKDLAFVGRDMISIMGSLPRQMKQILRGITSPGHSYKFQLVQMTELRKTVESGFNIVFLGLIVSSLVLSGSLTLQAQNLPFVMGLPVVSFICYALASFFGILGFYRYIKK